MRQLLLDLLPSVQPTLDNFVVGGNDETLATYSSWLASEDVFSLHLWGESAAGKSHLLRASGFAYFDAEAMPDADDLVRHPHLAVDRVDVLDPAAQIALFNYFNTLRHAGGKLLTASRQAPVHLALREDLRTRLGSGLICRLRGLSDDEKIAALTSKACERGMKVPADCLAYLLRHCPRDMGSLSAVLFALDRYSLEYKRPITLPLLREVIQETQP